MSIVMSRTQKIRASPFTSEELGVLVDGVLAQYPRLYGGPNVVLKVHQRKAVWRAIASRVRDLGVSNRRRTHCHKRWDDICRLSKNVAEMTLGLLPRTGRLARRSMTPLMVRILAVTQPELDRQLKEHQQQARAAPVCAEGEGTDTSGEASSATAAPEQTDTDVTSAEEGDRSLLEDSQPETQSSTSSDASGDASMLGGTGNGDSASSSATQRPVPSLPSTSTGAARVRTSRKGRVTFTPGTAAPAHVSPAALSAEAVELLRQLCVGQTALLNAFQEHDKKLGQVIAFMEGLHSDVGGLHRTVQSLSSTVTAALQQAHSQGAAPSTRSGPVSLCTSDDSDNAQRTPKSRYRTRSTQEQQQPKRTRAQTPSPHKSKATPERREKSPSGDSKGHKAKKKASGSQASPSSPAKDSPVPKTSRRGKKTVSTPTEKVLPANITQDEGPMDNPSLTSTPIPSPVKPAREDTVGGKAGGQREAGRRQTPGKRTAGSSMSPEGGSPSTPESALVLGSPVVSAPVPLNPQTGKPFRIPKKWRGTPPQSPAHTVSHQGMSPPPRATTPPGPSSPPATTCTVGSSTVVTPTAQGSPPTDPNTQSAPSPTDSPI